ncbi:MAG: aminotransferase class V-fold PLP-dependent enzyme [Coriobacteriales bacterium]|jgi:selenocysteine lyase/cysteine desulfurase
MIYLDNAATTFPKPECVYEACDDWARHRAVNAGRGAYRASREASALIARVRRAITSLADARDQADVVLAPSSTVALNQVINGAGLGPDAIVYVSPYEHNAVLRPVELLRRRVGFEVVELPLAADLSIDLDATRALFAAKPPTMVALTAASNVTGYVTPAREVFSAAREASRRAAASPATGAPGGVRAARGVRGTRGAALCVLDASQAFGLVRMPFAQTRADVVAFAGHKTLYGPFGVAGFLLRRGVELDEFIVGGTGTNSESLEMPRRAPGRYECASPDVVAIAGLDAALSWLVSPEGAAAVAGERELARYLVDGLRGVPGCTVYASPDPDRQIGVVSFDVEGFKANEVASILDARHDIAVRAGHHCAALIHRHLGDARFEGTVRASVGAFSTRADVDALLDALRGMDRAQLDGIADDVLRGAC